MSEALTWNSEVRGTVHENNQSVLRQGVGRRSVRVVDECGDNANTQWGDCECCEHGWMANDLKFIYVQDSGWNG